MKTFIEVELTICKNIKRFKTDQIRWFYINNEKAEEKFKQLEKRCHNYEDFCKGWKYLSVYKKIQKFDD